MSLKDLLGEETYLRLTNYIDKNKRTINDERQSWFKDESLNDILSRHVYRVLQPDIKK